MKWILILVCALLPLAVIAQDNTQEKQDQEQQQVGPGYLVIVEDTLPYFSKQESTTKLPELLLFTPASVDVVTHSLFETQGATYLGEALRNASGVNVQTGFGVLDYFTVRGFDSLSSALILTDGAPEPETSLYQLYNVDRVEVLKGPGAFLYGGNPLSGSVNLIRKQPQFDSSFHLDNSYGSFQSYRGTVDWNQELNSDVAFRVNGLWQTADNYRDDKDGHQFAINPSLLWKLGDAGNLNFNFEYLKNNFQPDSGIPIVNGSAADVPRTQSYQSPFDTSEQDIARFHVDYDRTFSSSFSIRSKFYYTDLQWLSKGTLINGTFEFPSFGTQVIRTLPVLDDHQSWVGNQFEALFAANTGSIKHELLTGFEVSRLGDRFSLDVALLPTISLQNPVETATEPLAFIPGTSQRGDARSIVLAPYVIDQIRISEKVRILAGGRFDSINFDDPLTLQSRNDSKFSPMGGVTISPTSQISVYASAGKAFAPPSTLTTGNLEPEESTQYEAGIKNEFLAGKASATFAVYHLDRKNIGIPDDNGITRQTGSEASRGVELELTASPNRAWNISASYAFNDSELTEFTELIQSPFGSFLFDRSGNTPAFAPKSIFNAWVLREFEGGFGIGGGPRYVSGQFIAEDNAFEIPGTLTFDAAAFYDWQQWRFIMNFKNLTNRKYLTRGFGSSSAIPANPFSVTAGVEWKL